MKRIAARCNSSLLYLLRKVHTKVWPVCAVFIFLHLLSLNAFAQTAVTGTVKDANGDVLAGVTVAVKNNSATTTTDNSGSFSINVTGGNGTLIFTMIGYKRQEVDVTNNAAPDVIMEQNATNLGEIVVVGYGKQSREKMTTAVSKLDNKTLENVPYTNVLGALQGSIPGARVQSFSGQPGLAPRVILRGGTSISNVNGSAPLFIVDGVIRPDMNDIPAEDIESIQVLKDAAATAIYGARGSNGVVLATTKSGKSGRTRIAYSYDITRTDPGNLQLEYLSASEYIQHMRQAVIWTGVKYPASTTTSRLNSASGYGTGNDLTNNTAYTTMYLTPANEHKLNEGWESMSDPADPSKTIIFKDTDYRELSFLNALSHNHFISASGGTDKARFSISGGYLSGEGIALASDYKRISVNANGSLQISKDLSVEGRVKYTNVSDHTVTGNPLTRFTANAYAFYRSASIPSTTKYKFEDGTLAPGQNSGAGNPHYYQTGPGAPIRKNIRNTFSLAISGKWNIAPGLSFDPQISVFEVNYYQRAFNRAFLNTVTSVNSARNSTGRYTSTKNYQADAVFTYQNTFGGLHNLEAKAGFSYFDKQYTYLYAFGNGGATDLIPTLNGTSTPQDVDGSESKFVTEGLFSRINYDYDGKYLLTLTARYDGASNLGADYRFGFFPGIGIGWNLHREKFWSMFPENLVSLKLRASYGENGNIQGLGDFTAQGLYSTSAIYGGNSAIQPSALPNPNLQWEQSKTLNIGFDLGLFDNRIGIIGEVFRRVTDNLLINVALPPSSGFSSVLTNFGSFENKGIELGLTAQVLNPRSALQWTVNATVSHTKSIVLKLPYNGIDKNRQGGLMVWDQASKTYVWRAGWAASAPTNNPSAFMEGSVVGDMYAFWQVGVYATDAEAANAPVDMYVPVDQANPANGRRKYGGDVNFADIDGNNIIDSRDQVYVGNMIPKVTGGFSNFFTYKNFNLNIRTDFTLGHTIFNYARVSADGQLQGDLMPTKEFIEKSWKKQGDITNTPRYLFANSQQNISRNSTYYEKGDFLCIREVSLGYNIPSGILQKVKLTNCRFSVTGSNLYYFTKYKGLNPEDGGPDNGRYPNPRGVTFSVNITL